jgi:hypothetical protein
MLSFLCFYLVGEMANSMLEETLLKGVCERILQGFFSA